MYIERRCVKMIKNEAKIKAKEEYMNEVSDWQKKGLPRDAAFAKVALDRIVKEIKKTKKIERNL